MVDLIHNLLTRPTPLPSPYIGNNAVGAEVVAPLHNRDIRFDPGCGALREKGVEVLSFCIKTRFTDLLSNDFHPLQHLWNQGNGMGSDHHIEVGNPLQQSLAFLLGHTAGPSDDCSSLLFHSLKSSKGAVDLLLRLFSATAGVDEDEVGLLRIRCFEKMRPLEKPGDLLRVMLIHLAAIGFDVEPL